MNRILIVDDDNSIRNVMTLSLQDSGYEVMSAASPAAATDLIREHSFDIVVTDLVMPRMDGIQFMQEIKKDFPDLGFIIITAYGSVEKAVEALHCGAYDFVTKPFKMVHLKSILERYIDYQDLMDENKNLKKEILSRRETERLVGKSEAMRVIHNQISIVAATDAPIFVQGESGTGKELIAQAIHDQSQRADKAFIKVNCAAIPDTLFESTLFGHEKGAFTNALKTTKGLFEEADQGTFLLDEISEMPIAMQAKLLRVLQGGVITRIGSSKEIPIDVRIIATSNRDINKLVRNNEFRADLFFRLNVFPIRVAPLRNRREDIPVLVDHFLKKFQKKYGFRHREVDKQAFDMLMKQDWAGNVRQLENLVERAILYSDNQEVLTLEHFALESDPFNPPSVGFEGELISIEEMERRMIFNTLKKTNQNRTRAADILGISVRTLRNKLHQYELEGTPIPE